MKSFAGVLIFSMMAFVSCQRQIPPGTEITQCQHFECPTYSLAFSNEEYEIRAYEPTKWMSTTKVLSTVSEEWLNMLEKVRGYFSGQNDQDLTMTMTAPAGGLAQPLGETENNVTVFLYIPKALHENTPKPTAEDLHLLSVPALSVYVRAFEGSASVQDFGRNLQLLTKSIGDPSKWLANMYWSVAYIHPLGNRRNEVWLISTEGLRKKD